MSFKKMNTWQEWIKQKRLRHKITYGLTCRKIQITNQPTNQPNNFSQYLLLTPVIALLALFLKRKICITVVFSEFFRWGLIICVI